MSSFAGTREKALAKIILLGRICRHVHPEAPHRTPALPSLFPRGASFLRAGAGIFRGERNGASVVRRRGGNDARSAAVHRGGNAARPAARRAQSQRRLALLQRRRSRGRRARFRRFLLGDGQRAARHRNSAGNGERRRELPRAGLVSENVFRAAGNGFAARRAVFRGRDGQGENFRQRQACRRAFRSTVICRSCGGYTLYKASGSCR